MNTFFDSLRKLESTLHLRHQHDGSAKNDQYLLLEIVMAKHTDYESILNLSNLPVWVVITIFDDHSRQDSNKVLITNEKTKSIRLNGCFFDQWIFKETAAIRRDSKILIQLFCRSNSSSAESKERVLGSVVISASQMHLGEAQDYPLECSHKSTVDDVEGNVGFMTLKLYESSFYERIAASNNAPLGSIRVLIWQGKAINTSCPCYVTVDISDPHRNMYPQKCRTPSRSNPHNPIFDYIADFNVYNLQGNVVINLFEENVARDIHLGQILIPLSWLTERLTLPELMVQKDNLSFSGWFEVFPAQRSTRYNRGGQYLPTVKGIPQSTGYGMSYPATPIGFIKLDISLTLLEPVMLTILRNPFAYRPEQNDLDDEEEAGLSSILVTGFALLRIFKLLKNPPFMTMVFDILNWKAPFPLCVCILYTVSYTALLASPWQYPIMISMLIIIIGKAAGNARSFSEVHAFSNEKEAHPNLEAGHHSPPADDGANYDAQTPSTLSAHSPAPHNPKKKESNKTKPEGQATSMTDQYKSMKREALKMEKSVQSTCSKLERYTNLLIWGDPILSGITAIIALVAAFLFSVVLLTFTPNQALFFVCLSLFTPKEIQDFVLKTFTERGRRIVNWFLNRESTESIEDKLDRLNDANTESVKSIDARRQPNGATSKIPSYTQWLKAQARKWIRQMPDDLDLQHKYICAAAFISREHEFERLPTKTKMFETGNGHGQNAGAVEEMSILLDLWNQALPSSKAAAELKSHNSVHGDVGSKILNAAPFSKQPKIVHQDSNAVTPAPKSIGDVYTERRRSQYLLLEKQISSQVQLEKQKQHLQEITNQQFSKSEHLKWNSTKNALSHFIGLKPMHMFHSAKPPPTRIRRTKTEFKKDFTLRITLISAKGLPVKSSVSSSHTSAINCFSSPLRNFYLQLA